MKKIVTALALISLLALPALTLAEPVTVTPRPETGIQSIGDLVGKINDIGDWIFTGLLILAGIFLIVAGFYFVTAGGNPEKVNMARQMLINALIGVAVAVAAKGLVAVITDFVGS